MRTAVPPVLAALGLALASGWLSSATPPVAGVRQMAPEAPGDSLDEPAAEPRVAPDALPPLDETRARRRALVELLRPVLGPGRPGAFFLPGAPGDPDLEFRQDSNFYYLAGLEVPSAAMVILFDQDRMEERLYLETVDDKWERYVGDILEPGAVDEATGRPDAERSRAIRISGFRGAGDGDATAVRPSSRIREDLEAWLGRKGTLFLAGLDTVDGRPDLEPGSVPEALHRRHRRTRFVSASFALRELRLVKSSDELARIRRAVEITCDAHRRAMAVLRPGLAEYQVEGIIEAAFTGQGARHPAFSTIVGSGPNSTVLHYDRNARTIRDGELVVVDIGAEYARYASDVTRTLPASGVFTPGQAEVYRWVLEAQQAGLAMVRPGLSIAEINSRVKEVLRSYGMEEAFWHGCCHFVGLDVHDVGSREASLKPGMVLTVEPGVYLPDRGFGIRIEDTVLVTGEGHEVLSACAAKEPEAIEAAMAEGRVSPGVPASRPR